MSSTVTSAITTTTVYTITSCAPTVTYCPIGEVTTDVITYLTTYCPGSETATPTVTADPKTTYTDTYTMTTVYTVTVCPAMVTDCPVGKLTTATYLSTTTWCPGQIKVPVTTAGTEGYPWGCTNCGGSGSESGSGSEAVSGSEVGYGSGSGSGPSSGSDSTYSCGSGSGMCTTTKAGAAGGTADAATMPTSKIVAAGVGKVEFIGFSAATGVIALLALFI
jgi:chitinase